MSGWGTHSFSSSDNSDYVQEDENEANDHIPPEVMQRLYIPTKYIGRKVFIGGPWYMVRRNNGRSLSVRRIDVIGREIQEERRCNQTANVSLT